jgi:hypothetical protein
MDHPIFQLHQSVQETLSQHPGASRAFLTLQTECVGCYLARFCSLEDVARTYGILPENLLRELEMTVPESYQPTRRNE